MKKINSVFAELSSKEISREAASNWAIKQQDAFDVYHLNFVPSSDEDLIWDALDFLISIDLQTSPHDYLYSENEIIKYKTRIANKLKNRL